MAIIKHSYRKPAVSPWRGFGDDFNRLTRLFDDWPTSRPDGGSSVTGWAPAVSVTETTDALVLTAELPGVEEKDISVELENDVLSISGEKSEVRTEGDEERNYHLWERRYGSFRRSFTLPRTISGDEVSASYENGVLTVKLPKHPEAKGRKIEISKN